MTRRGPRIHRVSLAEPFQHIAARFVSRESWRPGQGAGAATVAIGASGRTTNLNRSLLLRDLEAVARRDLRAEIREEAQQLAAVGSRERAEQVDARADLYALGVMLFEMLTATLPFEGPSAMVAAVARLPRDPPDPRTRAKIPDAMAELVLRCMAREPAARPASARGVAMALGLLADAGVETSTKLFPSVRILGLSP